MAEEKIAEKIRKLFALSQSPNEAEALAAAKKAHELLAEHNLSMADLKEPSEIGPRVVDELKNKKAWKTILLEAVADFNFCAALLSTTWQGTRYKLIGRADNTASGLEMYLYLSGAIERMAQEARSRQGVKTLPFCFGAAWRVLDMVKEAMIDRDEASSRALVVVSSEAREWTEKEYSPGKESPRASTDRASSRAGYQAAGALSLSRQVAEASR